jgi:hypothetical protein
VTGYWLDDRGVGVRVLVRSRIYSSPCRPDWLWSSTQPPLQWVPRVKRPRQEADHSRPTSAEVKKIWVYTSLPHTPRWRSANFIKYRDNFTFYHRFLFSATSIFPCSSCGGYVAGIWRSQFLSLIVYITSDLKPFILVEFYRQFGRILPNVYQTTQLSIM